MKPSFVVAKALSDDHETSPTELSINAFLINTGSKLILVDTGAGELFGPHSGGLLLRNLSAAGYKPEQVDAILLTHIHADHSGGLSIGGKLMFPNALVYVDKRDPDFWLSAAAEAANPNMKGTFKSSHQTVDPVVKAGKLRPYDGAIEIFPGIHSVPAYGHTPGHSGYLIESKGQRLLLWGDVIHSAEAQFADPGVAIEYDVDHDAAVATRKRLLSLAAKQGVLVGGAHISFPGLGHVKVQGDGYAWAPVPYGAMQ
jgi:glyoxylase-like metal-dependent hydrolase (beta-lactamase superfamily II)